MGGSSIVMLTVFCSLLLTLDTITDFVKTCQGQVPTDYIYLCSQILRILAFNLLCLNQVIIAFKYDFTKYLLSARGLVS